MTAFPNLTDVEIGSILMYVDEVYTGGGTTASAPTAGTAGDAGAEDKGWLGGSLVYLLIIGFPGHSGLCIGKGDHEVAISIGGQCRSRSRRSCTLVVDVYHQDSYWTVRICTGCHRWIHHRQQCHWPQSYAGLSA